MKDFLDYFGARKYETNKGSRMGSKENLME